MRNISFSMTVQPFLRGEKTVTRRLGWKGLKPGDRLMAVVKSQGLKKGEKVSRLGVIEVVSVTRQRLDEITQDDVSREGLPLLSREAFVLKFAHAMRCNHWDEVTRIEFRRVPSGEL